MKRSSTLFCIFQEWLESGDTFSTRTFEIYLVRCQGWEDLHLVPGSRDSNIKTSPAAFSIKRAEIQCYLSIFVLSVSDREEDNVPLIPLNIFQILYKDRFLWRHGDLLQVRPYCKQISEQVFNKRLLISVESDDTDTPFRQYRVF